MSKRNLYKPAPTQTPPHVARKPLAQGRLVSTDPQLPLNYVSPSMPKPSPQIQHIATPRARRSLDYNAVISATKSKQDAPSCKISPTIAESPAFVKPSSSLSLSETEEEPKKQEYGTSDINLVQPSVLIVDASERHSSFKDNEVPIKTSYAKSPVKVVCHSPMRQKSRSVPDSSQYANAGKTTVPVETVSTVNVTQGHLPKINDSQSSSSPPASEDGSLSTIAGSPVDPRSKAIETVVVREKNNPRSYVSFLDEDGSVTDNDSALKTLDRSKIHVRQPKFDDTAISSIAEDSTLSSVGEETKKKKRMPRVVQSKYMTSAMSRMGQKSSVTKRTDSRPRILAANKIISANSKIRKTKSKNSSKSLGKDREKRAETVRKDSTKILQFTSTPADVIHPIVANVTDHVPVITPAPNRSGPYEEASLLTPSFFTPSKDQSQKKETSSLLKPNTKDVPQSKDAKTEPSGQNRQNKQTSGDISQLQLDLQYARLCQWRFLRSKFKHTFEKQEKDAQEQMYSLWRINEQLRKKNSELQIRLETKRKLEELDHQLDLQLSILKSVDHNSGRLIPDYLSLFEGIDTTRHHVPVKDILLPENEGDLLAALDNCENTLGEITSILETDQQKVLSFSKEMQFLADTVQEERKEHDRCTELLAAASTLTTQEKSLQAELIQRKEP